MKFWLAAIFATGLLPFVESLLLAQPQRPRRGEQSPAAFGWLSSLEQGIARARMNGQPLMVVLRCGP